MNKNSKIAIITRKKLTDALICEAISKKFPNSKIIQYQVPLNMWISWIKKRIHNMGFFVFFGHVSLSIYLKVCIKIERLLKISLWTKYTNTPPSWTNINTKKEVCLSEQDLINKLSDTDLIILTDSFRLSYKFFRKTKTSYIQLVWGTLPNYMGDSGSFWAFANNDSKKVGISVIERFSQFSKMKVLEQHNIKVNKEDNLRTIKIKQALKMAEILPEALEKLDHKKFSTNKLYKEVSCRIFQAPTLMTYLHFLKSRKIKKLPNYSFNKKICKIIK